MATKKLRMQVLENVKELILASVMLVISIYCGIQVYFKGTGNRSKPGNSLRGLVVRLMYWLEDNGYRNVVVGIMLAIFGITALISLILIIYHLGYLTPKRSVLGRSVLAQASKHEVFDDLVQSIDSDLNMEINEFGTELIAGRQWLLSDEAMRIKRIERIYIGERKVKRKNKAVLLASDGDGNIIDINFDRMESRDEAVRYLRGRISSLYVGNLKEVK